MIELDKLAHGFAGTSIYSITRFACLYAGLDNDSAMVAGLLTSVIAGTGKEIYDSHTGGDVDMWDMVSTSIGGVVGISASYQF